MRNGMDRRQEFVLGKNLSVGTGRFSSRGADGVKYLEMDFDWELTCLAILRNIHWRA
jgi:hypothetical protein